MRTYLILEELVKNEDYLSIAFLMNKLNVSKRTIQSELSYLKKEGKKNGYEILNTYGKGYSLEIINIQDLNHFLKKLGGDEVTNEQGQLIYEELSILLSTNNGQYTSTSELAEMLAISNTSLYSKMDTMAEYLNSYHLSLDRKSHYGIRIIGEPKNLRKLMIDMYMQNENRFKKQVDSKVGNFDEYERLAQDCINKNNLRIEYYEFQVIMCWLRIIVFYKLFFDKADVTESTGQNLKDNLIDFSKFGEVLLKLQHNFQFVLNVNEVYEFYHLVEHSSQNDRVESKIDRTLLTTELINFFNKIDDENNTDYSSDKFFLENLVTHLEFLIARLDEKVAYKNPLLLELCIKYSMIFDIVLKLSTFLKDKFGYETSNDELGLIAVHFLNHSETEKKSKINQYEKVAVVCTTNGGISNLIRTRIQTIFPKSEVKAFPFWEYSELATFKADIIFSSVPLKNNPDSPVIYIKELISDKELENIKRMLFLNSTEELQNKYSERSTAYIKLIRQDLFTVGNATNYARLINQMSLKMIDNNYAYKNFDKDVALRERYMSTIYKNGIAIPHPIEMDGKKSAISIYIVKPKLIESGKDVKLVFMICLTKDDFYYYRAISNGIYQLMQNEQKIKEIYTKANINVTRNILREVEKNEY